VNHYLQIDNVLDEMMINNAATVLFNIDAHVREGALKPFPKLEHFYNSISSQVEADSVLQDSSGHRWMHTSFDHGRIRVQFMIQHGMLTPMNEALAPAGTPIDLAKIQSGSFVAHQWAKVYRLGMTFGLENVTMVTEFRRNATGARFSNHMSAIPQVIAPPIVNQVMMLLAGEFMRRLATGNGGQGVAGNFGSKQDPRGGSLFSGGISAEFYYSPSLEFLAKVGDAIASAHNEEVREEERRLGEELFNAFVTDYYRARPALIAMH
jgi:hypothetical protein